MIVDVEDVESHEEWRRGEGRSDDSDGSGGSDDERLAQDSTTSDEDEQPNEYKDKLETITGWLETPVSSERKCKFASGRKASAPMRRRSNYHNLQKKESRTSADLRAPCLVM